MAKFSDILTSVASVLATALPTYTVKYRKKPFLWEGIDTLPIVLVSGTSGKVLEQCFENKVLMRYGVMVAVYRAGNQELVGDAALAAACETIRQTLHKTTLSGVTITDVNDPSLDDLDDDAGVAHNYDAAVVFFFFDIVETRSV